MKKKVNYILYGITDSKWSELTALEKQVEEAIEGGVTIIQYREKKLEGNAKKEQAIKIREVCNKYDIPFLINDDVYLAKEIDADGVHLGQSDMSPDKAREILGEDKIIGVTAKTIEQAKTAYNMGANYLGSGAVFGTSTKLDAIPMNHDLFDEICMSVPIPVVAIGGINKNNITDLKGRKMSGFAIVSGIFGAKDIKSASKELRDVSEQLVK